MKKLFLLYAAIAALLLASCARPVIKTDLLARGMRDVPMSELAGHPQKYSDQLFVLGGIIANTTVTDRGTFIEALFVPVDKKGYFRHVAGNGRFIAVWPRSSGILDPLMYRAGRRFTVAGTFAGIKHGKIGSANYVFPVIDAQQIFLWKIERYAPAYFYYPYDYWYPYPYWRFGFYWWQ